MRQGSWINSEFAEDVDQLHDTKVIAAKFSDEKATESDHLPAAYHDSAVVRACPRRKEKGPPEVSLSVEEDSSCGGGEPRGADSKGADSACAGCSKCSCFAVLVAR